MKNRGLILAAGRGSRMGNATADKPKCLNILADKPLLEWQLQSLKEAGIDDLMVVRGYKSEMLEGDFDTANNDRWSETNMVSSLFCAPKYDGNSILSYSDIVYRPQHVKDLMKSTADITITADKSWLDLWSLRFEDPLDDAETFKSVDSKLMEIGKKTNDLKDIEAQYMGLLKLSPKGWDIMHNHYLTFSEEKKDKMDMTTMLNELLEMNIPIEVVFIDGGWCEADSYSDILAYEKELRKSKQWKHDWR